MESPELSLLVIRSVDIKRAVNFYSLLGFNFDEEKHGDGPVHYSTKLGYTVFEIYPIGKRQSTSDVRLGFRVDNLDELLQNVEAEAIVHEPKIGEFGRIAVVKDPDGHNIELTDNVRSS